MKDGATHSKVCRPVLLREMRSNAYGFFAFEASFIASLA